MQQQQQQQTVAPVEWLRRRNPVVDEQLRTYLFTSGPILGVEQGAADGGTIIPLEGLGGQFPTRPGRQSLAYAESISAVDQFVQVHGQERLVQLITSFGEGTGLDGAFEAATGEDFAAFESAWLSSLGADEPVPYGPRDSEPGPVPEEWTGDLVVLLG